MERYVARHRESAAEVERLREVAAGIGAAGASSPPGTLRERLLHAAEDRVSPLEADTALQRETDRFDACLDTLVEHDLAGRTHHDDLRRALARDAALPDAEVLRTMAELAMKALPLALAATDAARPGRTARIVLDGAGGGEWIVPCAPGESPSPNPDVVVRASV